MSDGFSVDVQELEQLSQRWSSEVHQVEKLPAQLSSIESHLGTLLENALVSEALNFVVGTVQLGLWVDLRSKLNDAAGKLGTLVQQLEQDSQNLQRCSVEYQIADDAAANGITNIQAALNSNAPGSSQIRTLLNSLSGSDGATAESTAQGLLGSGGSTGTGGTGGSGGSGGGTSGTGGTAGGSTGGSTGGGTAGGTGGGTGGSTGGGTGGPTGGGSTTTAGSGVTNTAGGSGTTTGNWDAGTHGPQVGQGMQTTLPSYSSLSSTRQQIMQNMLARVKEKIGYSQTAYTDGYRDDCSGTVSAAWGLSKPGLNTYGLMGSSVSHRITKDQLQPGDALIADDHVVLFGGWADSSHTQYYALEDDGDQGTVAHVIPYPYWSHNGQTDGGTYEPYAKNGVS